MTRAPDARRTELRSLRLPARRGLILIKRLCLLLAWSGWAWLGVGLYGELPREVGPMVCTLPLHAGELNRGFWGERQQIVSEESQGEDKPIVLRVWDPETGNLVRRLDGPLDLSGARWKFASFGHHMLVLAAKRPSLPGRPDATGPSVLDLEAGAWRDLPVDPEMKQSYPWGKPWAAFYGRFKENEPTRILIYDLRTGALIYTWTDRTRQGEPYELYRRPLFVGESLLLIPVHRPTAPSESPDERWELWSIAKNKRLNAFSIDIPVSSDPVVSPAARVAWSVPTDPPGGVDVFDVQEGRIVFSYPLDRRLRSGPGAQDFAPLLSEDGRTLFHSHLFELHELFDVDSGRILWKLPKARQWGPICMEERTEWISPGENMLVVHESVTLPLVGELAAAAVRSFSTGKFLYRYRVSSYSERYYRNRDATLAYNTETNTVHRWPPQINWPLLAFCQAFLALPLVLLWLGLRWRQRRRAGDVNPPVRTLADGRTGGLTSHARQDTSSNGDGPWGAPP